MNERRKSEWKAILSSCCGFTGEVVLTDSAVILLFAAGLGAGDELAMLTTSLLPLFNGLLLIPMAALAVRCGGRRLLNIACSAAGCCYFAAVAAPWFGRAAMPVLIGAIAATAFCLTGFIATWFPLLESFLPPRRRAGFLSRMRFCHQLSGVIFLCLAAVAAGKNPSIGRLQLILFFSGILFCGRLFWIRRIPDYPVPVREVPEIAAGLKHALANRPLRKFSLYVFGLNLFGYATVPAALLYLKTVLNVEDNVLILFSAASLAGMLAGYRAMPLLIRQIASPRLLLILHLGYTAAALLLFAIRSGNCAELVLAGAALFLHSFATAAISVIASAEMMNLARLGNKTMAMAFSGALFYGGYGLSRVIGAFLLGTSFFTGENFPRFFLAGVIALLGIIPFRYRET